MYEILLHPLAAGYLSKCPKNIRGRIKKKLKELAIFPKERGKHLRYTDCWSLRIGDYRAIFQIKQKEKTIIVVFIGHRDDVYDDFSKVF